MSLVTMAVVFLVGCSSDEAVEIKESDGFMVLDQQENSGESTIVAKAISGDDLGMDLKNGEVIVQNLYDYTDFVILSYEDGKNVDLGGIYLVKFDNGDFRGIEKNSKKISIEIDGQKVNEDLADSKLSKFEN